VRGVVPGEHVGGDGERCAQARPLRPAARPGGSDSRGRGRPVAAGSRGHRRQELGGGEGRDRHRALSPRRAGARGAAAPPGCAQWNGQREGGRREAEAYIGEGGGRAERTRKAGA
jgi:hypothetical protein